MRAGPPLALALTIIAACAGVALWVSRGDPASGRSAATGAASPTPPPRAAGDALLGSGTAPVPLAVRLEDPRDVVRVRFAKPPRAGLLFDVGTGRVLWRRQPTRRLRIASLTKMMTALVAADELRPGRRIRIPRAALRYRGSAVGLLPRGRRVGVSALLHGLLLPSGNDAARALAIGTSGSIGSFVERMNERAAEMGLKCTRFSSPDGYVDRGNHSCAADLAAIGRAVLRVPRLAAIVRRAQAVLPFPVRNGRLYLTNNNPLLRRRYPGVTGIKTGYTDAAGLCIVATARRGSVHLGVVLLDSPDWDRQARKLLDRGFKTSLGA